MSSTRVLHLIRINSGMGFLGSGWLCAGFAVLAGLAHATDAPAVIIDVRPVVYAEQDTFPRGKPPEITVAPELQGGMCVANWSCFVFFDARWPRFGFKTVVAEVTQVRIVTNLNIKIWLVEDAEASVLPHEKTHQAIDEHYYAKMQAVIGRLAPAMIGRKLTVPRKTAEQAIEQTVEVISDELRQEILKQTMDRCKFAQNRFDTINQHGQIPIENSVAMARAIAEEEAHWETVKDLKRAAN